MKKNKIFIRRKELGLTLEDIAKAVGVGKSTVAKWENDSIQNMKRDKIALLADILKIDPIDVLSMGEDSHRFVLPSRKPTFEEEVENALENIELKHLSEVSETFSSLNYCGQLEAISRIHELALIDKYKRRGSDLDFLVEAGVAISTDDHLTPVAARNDNEGKEQQRLMQEDLDDM
jgi:Predicted transcriptional regulators